MVVIRSGATRARSYGFRCDHFDWILCDQGDWGRPESKADSDQDGLSLQLERQGQMKLTKLVRPVTIVGDAAPSLMRWKGVGLSPCHGAIISQSGKIWYLPFPNDPLAVNPSDFIQQIDFDNPVQIGQVTVRRWSLETANRKSPPTKRMPSSENRPSPSASRPSKADMPTSTNASNLPVDVTDEVMRRMVELGRRRALPRRLFWLTTILIMAGVSAAVVYVVYMAMHHDLNQFL